MARNPYFRPRGDAGGGLEAGIANLAQMFAPPSMGDVYAGQKAAEVRQKMKSISDYYAAAGNPATDPRQLDIMAAGANLYNPTQGWSAQNQNTETKRRGDDLQLQGTKYSADSSAGAARYGHDRNYDASTQNNVRDNTRAVTTNTADNRTKTDIAMLAPVPKDATRFIPQGPSSLGEFYGAPPTQTGVVSAQPGEKNFLPDNRVLEGNPKPMTDAEMKGAIIGQMPPAQQQAIAFGTTPVENVGGVPKTRPEVLAGGVAPIDRTRAAQLGNYRSPDGRSGNFVYDPGSGQPVDAQTRQPLPAGSQLQSPSGVQNKEGLGPTPANTTEANRKDANRAEALQAIDRYATLLQSNPGIVGLPGAVRGVAQNALSVVQEFGAAFGNTPLDAIITPDQAAALASRVGAGTRDPAIAQARVMQLDLAYKMAQNANPTGEVSRQALERQLEAITGGSLPNNASALEALKAQRDIIVGGQVGIDRLRNPQAAGPGPSAPQAPAARPRATNPNTGEAVEWDGQAWVSVK